MPNTWSQLYLHVVFCTKQRREWITAEVEERLYSFMAGIVKDEKCLLYKVGGMPDHVHLLVRLHPRVAVSDLLREVKGRSSRWLHEEFPDLHDFAWQEGFGVFSVSKSQLRKVKEYIERQAEHHKTMNFKAEYLGLLRAHEIEFDERFVFD
jgi:putative transposase